MSEAELSRLVRDWLDIKHVPYWRMNSGDRFGSHKGKTWRIRGHEPGTADLLAAPVVNGHRVFLWLELKQVGKKLSPAQVDFEQRVSDLGMCHAVVSDLKQLEDWFREFVD